MSDIKYSYAVNKYNELVDIINAKKENEPFYLYGSDIKVIARQGTKNTWHFASYSGQYGGGESPEHYNAKMKIKEDGYFIFNNTKILPKKIEVEMYHKISEVKKKQPDVTFYDANDELMCAIEIYVTNKKTEEDIEYLKKLNIPVYEYDYHKKETRLLCWSTLTERYIERYQDLCKRESTRIELAVNKLREQSNKLEKFKNSIFRIKNEISRTKSSIIAEEKTEQRYKDKISISEQKNNTAVKL